MSSSERTPRREDDPIGRTIDGFRIDSLLGAGGMGRVYKAWDTRLSRPVALKTISSEQPPADLLARFGREGRALAALNHPNVAQIYFVGSFDGRPYLAMEYVEGSTLAVLLEQGIRLPTLRRLELMIQASEGLAAAWSKEIVHRDVKPSNLLIGADGRLRILDFGLARQSTEEVSLTATGLAVGTPHYMSPEQALGKSVDFRSDLYSLGATFYHLFTGTPPFESDSPVALLVAHVQSPAIPAHERNRDVPLALSSILQRLLAKEPAQRYAGYEPLLDDLRAARRALSRPLDSGTGEAMQTIATPIPSPFERRPVRIPALFLAALAVLVLVVAIGIGEWNSDGSPQGAGPRPPDGARPTGRASSEAPTDEATPVSEPATMAPGGREDPSSGFEPVPRAVPPAVPSGFLELAARSQTLARMRRIATALEFLQASEGRAPTDLRELTAGDFVHETELIDAWGRELRLTATPNGFRLLSSGADGVEPSDDDIVLENGVVVQGGFDLAPPPS